MRKPTLHDVARAAGVSYSTADRVLNARGGVAPKSAVRVQEAIAALGYERDLHAANLSRRRMYRFRFLLPKDDHSFFRALRAAVDREQDVRRADRIVISVTEIPALDPDALAAALEAEGDDCDCLALVATEAPRITAAIRRLRERGVAVVTLVSDAAPEARTAYVGIDNVMAGRTAGRLLRLAHAAGPGCILPVLGSLQARDHRERLEGALAVLSDAGDEMQVLPALAIDDRPDLMLARVAKLLAEYPQVSGIYSIGAGNRGLIELLQSLPDPRPTVIMHELTPTTRAGLERGLVDAVIDQKPAQEVALALDVMKAIADGRDWHDPTREIIPTIFLKDNLPAQVALAPAAGLSRHRSKPIQPVSLQGERQ
ncbi:LacI family DNA-binding transcriptional regulator [Yoonia sp.]|uniref:LacI family DNA-binding transcriptional regulator n=1 Tax=Yoonia sp. TaxID=2212373 RepID=UPI003A4DFDF8|nr:LacI family DNA-binding transcriptional regulator [Loktanella sp.]